MKKLFLLFLMFNMISIPAFAQHEIELKPTKRPSLLIKRDFPMAYKPSRLIIGQENKISIKAVPGSYVSLAFSEENSGAPLFYGHKLRLGSDIKTQEGIIPENGFLELSISLPNDKNLDGKTIYLEVAIWKNQDFSDLELAKIIGINGRETNNNDILVSLPPQNASKPTFAPAIPGAPIEMMHAAQFIDEIKKEIKGQSTQGSDVYQEMQNTYQTPVILRNLKAPELNTK
ncbi:MAG: hypothetical protein A2104_07045 [Candidatus Melainabacteria bacterium GWF2_32_7]|nr:MAG: hypothetical protein A2104_07045 [Candidatus Melainabacteria bacterium GWF2_32_7]